MQATGQYQPTPIDTTVGDVTGYEAEDYVPGAESFDEDFDSEAMAAAMDLETMDGPTVSDEDFAAVWKARQAAKEKAKIT